LISALWSIAAVSALARAQQNPPVTLPVDEGNYVIHDFHFRAGKALAEIRMHYRTLGKPMRDAQGRTVNAVLILHGTTGSGRQFLGPPFAGVLFGSGQLLDVRRYYIILPDNLGHGGSSKPSDGMRAHFPEYDYMDMVRAQHDLVVEGLGVNHLRLVMGTSMGCMHSWMWGEMFPDEMDALMPLACLPVQIAGRNRIWRKLLMDAIRDDPAWKGGDYTSQPQSGLRTAIDLLLIAGSAPMAMQKTASTRDIADQSVQQYMDGRLKDVQNGAMDANDVWYAFNASRDYDPSPDLEKIRVPVMFVNSADDFINPPELGIAEREIQQVRKGRYVLIPASEQTHGHGTHTAAVFWQEYLKELLAESGH
jgi:homoserine O-acetyltransferase